MTTHTITTKAWITQYSTISPDDLEQGKRIEDLAFYTPKKNVAPEGWTFAGEAVISFTPVDRQTLVDNKVEALKAEAAAIRAEAQAKVTRIEGQIQNLLAISYDAKTVEE